MAAKIGRERDSGEVAGTKKASPYRSSLPPPVPDDGTLRYDALHLFGTDNMSTADVQAYFDTYDPHFSVEWVNDSTCNIVFSNLTVARDAYETLGTETILFDSETAKQFTQEELTLLQWRKCSKTHPKAENGLFLRYAVNKDHKVRGAASQSAYYQKYGRQQAEEEEEEEEEGGGTSGSDLRATLERKRRFADEGRSDDDLRQELLSTQKRRKAQEALYREREAAAEGARMEQDLRETLRKTQSRRGPRRPPAKEDNPLF